MTLIPCKGTQKNSHSQICPTHISSPHGLSAPLDLEIANYPKRGVIFSILYVPMSAGWVSLMVGAFFSMCPPNAHNKHYPHTAKSHSADIASVTIPSNGFVKSGNSCNSLLNTPATPLRL